MRWTKEEIDYLMKNYPTKLSLKDISKHLKKSIKSIKHKAARENLSRIKMPYNKPDDKNHRNIIDKKYYEKNKNKIYKKKKQRWKKRKLELINLLGGKCKNCGYNKCVKALDFHHTNGKKENCISIIIKDCSKQKVLKEVKKCIILCANCHRELHNNLGA